VEFHSYSGIPSRYCAGMEFDVYKDPLNTDCIWATYTELGSAAYQAGDLGIAKIMFVAAKDEAARRGFCDRRWEISVRNMSCISQAIQARNRTNNLPGSFNDNHPGMVSWSKLTERHTASRLKRIEELAESYASDGRYFRAGKLYQQLTELIEEILGPSHPTIVPRLLRLAWVYSMQKKHSKALEIYGRANTLTKERKI
jgi:tetratricopeptide (TPR) repeat protein